MPAAKKKAARARGSRSAARSTSQSKKGRAVSKRRSPSSSNRGREERSGRPSAGRNRDAIQLLTEDHKEMRRLLKELRAASTESTRTRSLAQVRQALKRHTSIEEQIFYPAFREAAEKARDRELFHEAYAEHEAADLILGEVGTANDEQFPGRAKVLEELVLHHAEEEEMEMFPRARRILRPEELVRLGEELEVMKSSQSDQAREGTLSMVANAVKRAVGA